MKNVFAAFLCLIIVSISAQDVSKFGIEKGTEGRGLKVGDVAPNFELIDANGESYSLYSALKDKEVAVVFYRGAWCPVCSRYLNNFTDSLSQLSDANIEPVFITPNRVEKFAETKEKTEGKLILLHDENYSTMDAYKVAFEVTAGYKKMFEGYTGESVEEMNASEKAKLPVPATFVIGKDRKVKFVQFDYNYSNRASVKDIIESK